MLPEGFLAELKYVSDIEQVIGSYVTLKRTGRTSKGLCPFHSEKTPSFVVYPESQSFYCFGCGAGGDVVTFIRRAENLEYVEAVKLLADRAGIQMPQQADDGGAGRLKLRILEVNREAARYYYDTLMGPQGAAAREYLAARGMSAKMLRRFGLGYAPESWDALRDHLRHMGYSYEELAAASLVLSRSRQGEAGRSYFDNFRNRIMFPIIDLRGNVIAFGGRNLGERGPKYLNSADTPVFKKSRNLFALNFAKDAGEDMLILAEGYMDVIAMHQAGFTNAVATLGTALTPEQARLTSSYAKEVVLAYDSDEAGRRATQRAVQLFSQAGVKVRILSLENAKDPDEYLKKFGPARFKQLLSGSANATEFEIDKLRGGYNLETEDGKLSFLKEFSRLMAGIPNPIERDVYISRWAAETGVSREAINAQVQSLIKQRGRAEERKGRRSLPVYSQENDLNKRDRQRVQNISVALAEDKLILFLMKNPDSYEQISAAIAPEDFITDVNRNLYTAICGRLAQKLPVDAFTLAPLLGTEEVARLSWLLATPEGVGSGRREALDYIESILAHKNTKRPAEVGQLAPEDWERYMRNLGEKKK